MMKSLLQILGILALVGAAGTASNLLNRRNPERHLAWSDPDRYRGLDTLKPGPPSDPQEGTAPAMKVDGEGPARAAAAPAPAAKPSGEFQLITLADAFKEYEADTLFLDARRTRDYETGHITGALSLSAWEADLDEKVNKLAEERVFEEPIVIYCSNSKECEDSKLVGGRLKARGFTSLMIYTGGFPEWSKEKKEFITTGKEPGKKVGK
jgi:rhodanese-related sulfurtransferase